MKRFGIFAIVLGLLMMITACTRIETGEVGVRTDFFKQVVMEEIPAGKTPQTLIGTVNTFPVRDVSMHRKLLSAQAADSILKNFEYTVVYNIVPGGVAELWAKKSRNWHAEQEGDIYLMWNYIANIADNAAQKAVRKHKSLIVNDQRTAIESDIKAFIEAKLAEENLQDSVKVSQIQMNQALPADDIVASANRAVKAEYDYNTKVTEVRTAEKEAERIGKLNANPKAIEYMNAQANLTIADAVNNGKVGTIVIPYDFRGMMNIK